MLVIRCYNWIPPSLSENEQIQVGRKISIVGHKAFVMALKARITKNQTFSKEELFSYSDIFMDAKYLRDNNYKSKIQHGKFEIVLSSVILLSVIVYVLYNMNARFIVISGLLASMALTAPFYYSMTRRVDRWAQSLVDEYNKSMEANTGQG